MDATDLGALQQSFSGTLLVAADAGYEAASKTFMGKGNPAIIARPKNAADVALAIAYARDHKLPLSIRSGGHSNAGHCTNTDGVVIDMREINSITVSTTTDPVTATIGSGAVWSDAAQELQKYHLALSSGDTKSVGIGGLTLSGGIGWMVRKYGLTLDSLMSAEVVTADGTVLIASETEHPDLFWAIRGGGGNFGIVTNFTFKVYSVGKVYAGSIVYAPEDLEVLLKGWRDHMRTAPEELTTMFVTLPSFGEKPPSVLVLCCYAGEDEQAAMAAIEPLQKMGTVLSQTVGLKEYADVLEEAHPPGGLKAIVNNVFIQNFSDELVSTIVHAYSVRPMILQIRSVGGAINRVPVEATAFAHRTSEAMIVCPTFVSPEASPEEIEAALRPWKTIAAYGSGAYVSFFSEDTGKEVLAAYPPQTYERLVAVKQQYDPENIFNGNYNIKPERR